MPITTKLYESFWADEDIGKLSSEEKLAVLWMLSKMNNIGFLKVSRREFEFQTQAPCKALEGALKGLGRSFVVEEQAGGLSVLALNYVQYQFGDTAYKANSKNYIYKNLLRLGMQLSDGMREALAKRYEGLAFGFETLRNGLSPLQAPSSPIQGTREEKRREEKSTEGMQGEDSDAELFHVVQKNGSGGLRYDLAEETIKFLNQKTGARFACSHAELHRIALCLHQVDQDAVGVVKMMERMCALWGADPKMQAFLRPSTLFGDKFLEYFGQRDLPVVRDERGRAAELQAAIDRHPANRESVHHRADVSPEQKEQFKKMRRELAELRGET